MFKHRATFTDGPCQGRTTTVHSETADPPAVTFVHVRADGHRYELDPGSPRYTPTYHYAGPTK